MKNWLMFGVLGLIWGSSYLLIKIGVQELDALSLVSGRLGVTAIAFSATLLLAGKRLPPDRQTRISLVVAGILNPGIPFLLITWAENSIDSGLASVLNATTPLFTIVIAHVALSDDKISAGKLFGLITGFFGVILLALRTTDPTHANSMVGQLAMLLSSLFYGMGAVYVRRNLRHVDPLVNAGSTMIVAAICVITVTLLTVHPLPTIAALQPRTQLAVLGLGLINTFIAFILYFNLIKNWGASRTMMVNYIIPVVGLILGTLIDKELIDLQLIVGSALIVGGVALANLLKPPSRTAKTVEGSETTPASQTAS